MNDNKDLILANVVRAKQHSSSQADVLTFVHFDAHGQSLEEGRSYRTLWENGQKIAAGLDKEGMQPGQRFALVMQNHPEFVDAMVGSSIAGTVFVPIDGRCKAERLEYLLRHSECVGAVVADYALDNVLDVLDSLPLLQWLWVLDTGLGAGREPATPVRITPLRQLLQGAVPNIDVRVTSLDEPMQLLFTSGTTGHPKAIVSSYARFAGIASMSQAFGMRADDRLYTGLSLTHANAQFLTLGSALFGGLFTVISRRFTKSRLWEVVRQYNCSVFNLLGGMTTAIFAEPPKPDDAHNPVRYVISAGMPKAIWKEFAQRFNVDILEFYGAAEGGLTINQPATGPIGSVGKPPASLQCAILDGAGNEVPAGQCGEICFRPSDTQVAAPVTYLNNSEASAAKTRGGWFHSGDIGHTDEHGWLYFDYREGGGIRRNGEFIDPAEVEKGIASHQWVADVFVYGVSTASCAPGEKELVAAVVPSHEALQVPDLFEWCRRALPRNLIPRYVQVVSEIPKTASEKPVETELKQAFERGEFMSAEPATPRAAIN